MTRRTLDALTVPAWLVIFTTLGALLGLFAWALSWALEYVKSFL